MSVMAHAAAAPGGGGGGTSRGAGRHTSCSCLGCCGWSSSSSCPPAAVHGVLQSQFPDYPGYYYRDVNVGTYATALRDFLPHFGRSLLYAGLATIFGFILGYPLAYAMAFKAGKWRNVMMICVIAPFFTSFILRTIAWRQILADEGPVVSTT